MKKVIVLFLVLAVMLQCGMKGIIIACFELNRNYIAQNLCVQKDKKNNCCKGNCYLKKQLEREGASQKAISFLKEKAEWFEVPTGTTASIGSALICYVAYHRYIWIPYAVNISSIFHPPPFSKTWRPLSFV